MFQFNLTLLPSNSAYCNVVKENKYSYSYSYPYSYTSGIERRSVNYQLTWLNISAAKHLLENPEAPFFM